MTRQPSPEVSVRNPRALTADEIDAFCVLIRKGDEVDEAGLPVRVRQAEALACVRVGDRIVGVAALKNPQPGYRQGVFEKAKAALDPAGFAHEIGWAFVEDDQRGRHFSRKLVGALLDELTGSQYATSRAGNAAMHGTLRYLGFEAVGRPFPSAKHPDQNLVLFVRRPRDADLAVDWSARRAALDRWALPEGLHVPIAAVDEAAIAAHVGEIAARIAGRSSPRALLVRVPAPPPRDERLPVWEESGTTAFFAPLQLWVDIAYTRYRPAYRKAFPGQDMADRIVSHAMNRRTAAAKGYQFVRATLTSRGNNSSSAYSEEWAVERHASDARAMAEKRQGASIQYADLADLMLMADFRVGGGVMELVNEGQRLVTPPR